MSSYDVKFPHPTQQRAMAFNAEAVLHHAALHRAPKHRMVIVCCGCGAQVDLPGVSELVQSETTLQRIVYRAVCPSCGFTHRIQVSQ